MAPIKRKNESGVQSDHAKKKQKSSSTARPSILREEEPAFPRGGASVLTPLEHKQIQIQARQDVLFEQKTGQKIANQDIDDEEFDENTFEQADAHPVNSKRRSNAKFKKKIRGNTAHESSVRIEGLSYKVCLSRILLQEVTDCWLSASCLAPLFLAKSLKSIDMISLSVSQIISPALYL